jgi:hypothetical protein
VPVSGEWAKGSAARERARSCTDWRTGPGAGLAYGALLWVVGPLLLMPAKMGPAVVRLQPGGAAEPSPTMGRTATATACAGASRR